VNDPLPAVHVPHCNTKCVTGAHWLHDDETGHAHERELGAECAECLCPTEATS
jgi:hypothetical protein